MQYLFLFGFWDVPETSYWLFYFILGAIGFLVSYWNRLALVLAIPTVLWFVVSDFRTFYRYPVHPDNWWVFSVSVSMMFAVIAPIIGATLGLRKKARSLDNENAAVSETRI
jgi:hypothetical protein